MHGRSDEARLAIGGGHSYLWWAMFLLVLFGLGIANFAVHKAVLESGHPMLDALPGYYRQSGGRFSLWFEFFVLLAAMLLAGNGWAGAAVAYAVYSLVNFLTAWLVLTRRI